MASKVQVRRSTIVAREGDVEFCRIDWSRDGERPVALLVHANGCCAATWGPIAERLADTYRVIAYDLRGHGDSTHLPWPSISPLYRELDAHEYRWGKFARDLVVVAEHVRDQYGRKIELCVGHSFSGSYALMAAAERGDLFARLVLLDPVLPDPERGTRRIARRMAEWALARPERFDSRAAAKAAFYYDNALRAVFGAWKPECIDALLDSGCSELSDGTVVLKCSRAIEAAVYEARVPLEVLTAAAASLVADGAIVLAEKRRGRETFDRAWTLGKQVADASNGRLTLTKCENVGHFLPMEEPERVAASLISDEWALP